MGRALSIAIAASFLAVSTPAGAETVTIATVNNGDMIRMQQLADHFVELHPEIDLEWVVLDENVLRQQLTRDIAEQNAEYDILTIGTYEVPIWGERGWLVPLDDLPESAPEDLLPPIREALTVGDTLYALPFYGESAMVMYRTDLFAKAGLEMPRSPSWEFIADAARRITDREGGIHGICLRGKPGWGENMALLTSLANSFGARWFDMDWRPQFDSPEWRRALSFYLELMKDAGPPRAARQGFNQVLARFQSGKCGIWIDATVAASFLMDPSESGVADDVGFAIAPYEAASGQRMTWLWAWALAIPSSSKRQDAARTFISWATSEAYSELVAETEGWAHVPPGTRTSLYTSDEYRGAAPFADLVLESIAAANSLSPTKKPVPYRGVQYVSIPEFQSIGTAVGQVFAAALSGQLQADDALHRAQKLTEDRMRKAGYPSHLN